ncbi:hypothetical protein E05_08610 [Plautia stali symbiont]|nr:hypothetical protein E05_08610 [Plautia stali symbiont]
MRSDAHLMRSGVFHRDRRAGQRMEVHVEADHSAAGTFVHLNFLHVQRMHRKDVAMLFALRRRCATVTALAEIGARLNGTLRQFRHAGTGAL